MNVAYWIALVLIIIWAWFRLTEREPGPASTLGAELIGPKNQGEK